MTEKKQTQTQSDQSKDAQAAAEKRANTPLKDRTEDDVLPTDHPDWEEGSHTRPKGNPDLDDPDMPSLEEQRQMKEDKRAEQGQAAQEEKEARADKAVEAAQKSAEALREAHAKA